MTHSQAVEQIRRGGHRIHLVLKRGNGYVPDYGEKPAPPWVITYTLLPISSRPLCSVLVLGRILTEVLCLFRPVAGCFNIPSFSGSFLVSKHLCLSLSSFFLLPVELSSLSLCMTNSKLGEPCFYVVGRTENTRLVMVPVSSPIFCLSTYLHSVAPAEFAAS